MDKEREGNTSTRTFLIISIPYTATGVSLGLGLTFGIVYPSCGGLPGPLRANCAGLATSPGPRPAKFSNSEPLEVGFSG